MQNWYKVKLKSGGPAMEVTSSSIDLSTNKESVICKWNDEGGELRMATFDLESLDILQ